MRAILCRELGPPSVLAVEELAAPELGPRDVRVRVHASGINFPDILMVAGTYQHKPPLPFIPGFEAAGEVIELGTDAAGGPAVGDRVMVHARTGAYADEMAVPADAVMAMPLNRYGMRPPSSSPTTT